MAGHRVKKSFRDVWVQERRRIGTGLHIFALLTIFAAAVVLGLVDGMGGVLLAVALGFAAIVKTSVAARLRS